MSGNDILQCRDFGEQDPFRGGREGTGLKKPRGWLMILFIWNNKNMGLFLAKKLA